MDLLWHFLIDIIDNERFLDESRKNLTIKDIFFGSIEIIVMYLVLC